MDPVQFVLSVVSPQGGLPALFPNPDGYIACTPNQGPKFSDNMELFCFAEEGMFTRFSSTTIHDMECAKTAGRYPETRMFTPACVEVYRCSRP